MPLVHKTIVTSKTPCLANGDVRASPKDMSVFGMASISRLSGFRTTKLETHVRMCSHPTSDFCKSRNYWVSSHTSNLSKIGQSHPEIRTGGGGARAHVQRCPTPPMACGKHVLSDPNPHTKFEHNRSNRS